MTDTNEPIALPKFGEAHVFPTCVALDVLGNIILGLASDVSSLGAVVKLSSTGELLWAHNLLEHAEDPDLLHDVTDVAVDDDGYAQGLASDWVRGHRLLGEVDEVEQERLGLVRMTELNCRGEFELGTAVLGCECVSPALVDRQTAPQRCGAAIQLPQVEVGKAERVEGTSDLGVARTPGSTLLVHVPFGELDGRPIAQEAQHGDPLAGDLGSPLPLVAQRLVGEFEVICRATSRSSSSHGRASRRSALVFDEVDTGTPSYRECRVRARGRGCWLYVEPSGTLQRSTSAAPRSSAARQARPHG